MKAYLAHKFYSDGRNRKLIEDISESLKENGVETVIMARDFEDWGNKTYSPEELMRLSFKQIDDCDILILEFSEKGTGLGIEAGYAYAKNKPIYVVAVSGSEISTTLKGIVNLIIFYSDPKEVGGKIKEVAV